jgi:hypothetical protein
LVEGKGGATSQKEPATPRPRGRLSQEERPRNAAAAAVN